MADGQGVASSAGATRLPDLHRRTRQFALGIIHMYACLPKTTVAQVIGKQVLRSGTSVGAHCREAHRARSDAEFVSKIELALQELEETAYWLEILSEAKVIATEKIGALAKEADELTAMIVVAAKRVKHRTAGPAPRE
jgi:four helix bundle protein